jgi:two-component sensor histidine kinase
VVADRFSLDNGPSERMSRGVWAPLLCPETGADHDIPTSSNEASLELLVRELQHRIRNLLTVVQCFVVNTEANTADSYRDALSARIASLSEVYALVESSCEYRVSLTTLLERTLKPHLTVRTDRIVLTGPDIALEPRLALPLHMIFHELATNAIKHGALATRTGSIEVVWDIIPGLQDRALALQWRERGGPAVKKPCDKGYGMRLVSSALSGAHAETEFAPSGLIYRLLLELQPPSEAEIRS